MDLTFKQFLHVIEEGTAEDISKLQADISAIDTLITQRTAPLTQRKTQLQKLLMQKQQQQQAEQKSNPNATTQQEGPRAQQQRGTATTTPGSVAGSGTPGG